MGRVELLGLHVPDKMLWFTYTRLASRPGGGGVTIPLIASCYSNRSYTPAAWDTLPYVLMLMTFCLLCLLTVSLPHC